MNIKDKESTLTDHVQWKIDKKSTTLLYLSFVSLILE